MENVVRKDKSDFEVTDIASHTLEILQIQLESHGLRAVKTLVVIAHLINKAR
jgi:hypothetical protein